MRPSRPLTGIALIGMLAVPFGCSTVTPTSSAPASPQVVATPSPAPVDSPTPRPTHVVHVGNPVEVIGAPIDIDDLSGRIVFDDFEDVFAMDVDGSNVVVVAGDPAGSEFDGAWSPDGEWIVYRDSTRGINENDEIYVARADGTEKRNLTDHPANDWGPDWSPDGSTIAFNSDRDGVLAGFLMNPDGTNVRRIDVDGWVEYPSFSPDGTRIVYESNAGNDYDLFIADLASGERTRLTDGAGGDGWPAWSPDGRTIAFSSERDACEYVVLEQVDCWETGEDPHRDTWLIDADGTNLRRLSPELGSFMAWSPDGDYLVVSGHALYVVRPDGTGRIELRTPEIPLALGGIPDWR